METLFIKFNGETKTFLLNTNSKACEDFINQVIDTYQPDDWWIEDGWVTPSY